MVELTGRAGGPPLVPPGRAATVAAELADRLAAATGVQVDGAQILAERAAFTGHRRCGAVSAGGACRLLPTADGWAAVSCARPDDPALLGALAGEEAGDDPWPVAFYRLLHAGHHCVTLDPRTGSGRAEMAALVRAADIVIESSRPRALARFGLDAEGAAAAGTTWVSITAYGRASDRVGFGDDVAAGAGLVARDADGLPLFVGDAIADPLTGLAAATAAACAPAGGALLDIAMSDVVAATLDPARPDPASSSAKPSLAARRDGPGWVVDAAGGVVPVAPPRRVNRVRR